MGCGKSSKLVTPAFVVPNDQKDPEPPADTRMRTEQPPPAKPQPPPAVTAPRPPPKPVRITELAALYPPQTGRARLRLEYIYGYRCGVSRNNVFYLSASDIVVYPCGSVATLLSVSSNTQRFLGGGEVHTASGHFGDVIAVAVNKEKDTIATSDLADMPTICLWKLPSTDPVAVMQLPEEAKGVDILAFSHDSTLLAAVDMSAEQTIRVFQIEGGSQLFASTGKPGKVRALSWSLTSSVFCSAGDSNVFFWTKSGSAFPKTKGDTDVSMNCVKWNASSNCLTGGIDGKLYVWAEGRLTTAPQVLPSGTPITALCVFEDEVLVGGKDGKVHVLSNKYEEQKLFDTPGAAISLDMSLNGIVCGTEEGILLEFGKNGRVVLMDVHSQELCAAAVDPKQSTRLVTAGGDNKVKHWDLSLRKCLVSGLIEVAQHPVPARALCLSPSGQVAIGHSDGHLTIRTSPHQLNNIRFMRREPKSAISCLQFSPNGDLLAVGTEGGIVHVYNARNKFAHVKELPLHKSAVVAIDWNAVGTVIRTQDTSLGMCWSKAETGEKLPELSNEKWASATLLSASVSRLQPLCSSHSHKSDVSVQGMPYGVLELSSSGQVSAFKVHSGAIRSVFWGQDDDSLFSTGAADMCIMQWKLT